MSLKQRIFERALRKQTSRETRFPHLDRPLKVMLLYESDVLERNDAIKTIRQDLLRRQMDVTMWGFVEKKEIVSLVLPQSRILGLADFNMFGKPRDYELADLKAEHFDLLLDLTTRPLRPLKYLALYTNADFKVGLNLGEGIHDMLISPPNFNAEQGKEAGLEATWLYDQILRYITTIRSMD